jgi:hypothetical protein
LNPAAKRRPSYASNKTGKLKPVKLRKNGRVFHRVEDMQALIAGGD